MFFNLVLALVGLVGASVAQVLQAGPCNSDVTVQADFDIDRYIQGSWLEWSRTPHPHVDGDCSTYQISSPSTGDTYQIGNEVINNNFLNTFSGTVTFGNGTDAARLRLNLESVGDGEIDYYVLLTDYDNFALTYSCQNIDAGNSAITLWKLSRQPNLPDLANALMSTYIYNNLGINATLSMVEINHTEQACYILPEIEEGQPIVIPGACDTSIAGVQDFDVERFLGRWLEISSYISESTQGTCPAARYTLNTDGSVGVQNSEVVEQALRTISGTAVIARDDNSGVLNVTLEVAPGVTATMELKILATDYDNYAISYTCVNVQDPTTDTTQRRVFSWILSRQNELSIDSQAAVSEFIDTIIDLNDNYYIQADRSYDSCFYYPEHVENQPVVFPESCNFNGAMTNFNLTEYLGVWYGIEAYPTESQTGTCNTFALSESSGTVTGSNTQVSNELLQSINGGVTLATDDGRGIIQITVPGSGNDSLTTISLVVVAMDHNSYALAYTCENLPDGERRVWGVKLSRTRALSSAATTNIDTAMAAVDILDQRYFQSLDHSPAGCFYYPEHIPGRAVVFPGQCDLDITALPNFDINRFEGRWYEIEAYPIDDQQSQCINHVYSAGTDSINLTSTHITDQLQYVTDFSALFSSTDGSGKFEIVIDSVTIIPIWILDTDYNNYALGYSCVNINSDLRKVYSWKLSKTKELSAAAIAAIDNAISISQINVLQPFPNTMTNAYYEHIDQSDLACFYFPDLAAGEPVILVGQCDNNIPVVPNFDPESYSGRWRLIESYPADFEDGTCNDANYSLEDGVVIVTNTQVVNQLLDSITGTAVVVSSDESAKLEVTFPVAGTNTTVTSELWILDTDYDSYSLAYSCVNISPDSRRVWSWKLSRSRELPDFAITNINAKMDSIDVLNNRYFEIKDHTESGCFYYPEPNDQPVRFRGQCDPNVQAMSNFNVTGYEGLWHEIQGYPSTFQQGTCNNARYSLNGNVVDVYNTQVINQTLDFINGQAVIASDDGSAKLTVTFPVAGTEFTVSTSYWVLDTDYTSYALVYTCENFGEDEQAVFSWILGRSRTFSIEGNTNINNIINSVQVLDQRYYQTKDQSDEGCFYYPEVTGEPVIYPGQCDISNIYPVSNISIELFQGTWYEIEAYPKTQTNEGQCISYEYSVTSDSTLDFTANQVIGLDLDTTNAVLQLTTDNGEAKFNILINVNNEQVVIPYWILATDYINYAFAYSCINIDEYTRGVWSWKLSRTKEGLTNDAKASIEEVMSEVDVLEERFFESSDLSDASCFYLPDITQSEPVIFPGSCDESIPTIQNFDPSRYEGRWFDIQSYYDAFQDGTCNDAEYNLTPEGVVDVYNTMVVNQTLEGIRGTAVTTDESGKLIVNFPIAGTEITTSSNYWVLDTDYESYALVYSCTNLPDDTRRVYSWKLSRSRELDNDSAAAIDAIVNSIDVLNDRYYIRRDHTEDGCFYFPEVDPSQEVVFRGQCDENIDVEPQLIISRVAGPWYDVSSYPDKYQIGTCPFTNYTLQSDNIEIYHSQVYNQELQYITGYFDVEFVGNAKFEVDYPIPNSNETYTMPQWVLATDYDNYALVYSCVNTGPEHYTVKTWKLSRETTLSESSEAAINQAMSNIRVLDDRYFIDRSYTEESCFYYPENFGGPVILEGVCNENQNVVTNFNLNEFAGTWHEIARFPSQLQSGECVSSEFVVSGQTLSITQTIIYNERLVEVIGTFTAADDGRGVLTGFFNDPSGGNPLNLTLYVLDANYDDHVLLFSCVNVDALFDFNYKQIFSWKLSRSASGLSDQANANIDAIVTDNVDLFERYYEYTIHDLDTCFYYPVYDDSVTAIELPGLCDERIQAVPNFEVDRYLGRWFEMARYPQAFEEGACARAHYSLNDDDNAVRVLNEIVSNRTLETIIGSAVVASADGSGLLDVTFEVNGVEVTSNYYVLSTDYDNYALVYSCRNLQNGNRLVSSWKLSRERTLDNEYNDIINPIIENTQGLKEEYYRSTSQSDTDCFYVPEVSKGNNVLFRGQCANINGVQDFDVQRYLGVWYEIESYSTSNDRGECIRSEIQNSGNEYTVYDNSVSGLDFIATTSTLEVSQDGRLTRTSSDGQTSTIWVLATDYDNYALLYSCEIEDDEYIRVWSSKHSKTQELLTESKEAMAPIIEENDLLHSHLYLPVDQSDDACFYVPEVVENQTVVFRGQCENITGVQGFDVERYLGWWHEIESYPTSDDRGVCISSNIQFSENQYVAVDTSVSDLEGVISTNTLEVSNDGRLTRILSNGDTSTVWVLATDYDNYALVYSCENIDNNHRRVWSAKHSKTNAPLSTAAQNALTPIITENRVLYDQFYFPIDQSDDDCFYIPEVNADEAVIFRGQCGSITGIQDFDIQRFLGWWHEIESYPTGANVGDCISSNIQSSGNQYLAVDTSVFELAAEITTNTLQYSSDGSLTRIRDGESSTVWILATDYNNYALLFSCENINNYQRRVWSAKHSKTRGPLSTAAQNALAPIIIENRLLYDQFYSDVSQSDEDCFYVPEFNADEAVIFRGQCEVITGVQGFDIQRFLGWWHEIESYPTGNNVGDCISSNIQSSGNTFQAVDTSISGLTAESITSTLEVSNDGRLTRVQNGVSSTVWVLATDYDNYALLYSCENINSEQRRIWTAKHSKTRQLSQPAQNVMESIIAENKVLYDHLYASVDQTDVACFYYPADIGQLVILPGQCDENIPVVQSFDVVAYTGVWYQTERYPQIFESGYCTGARYTLDEESGVVTVLNWEVLEDELETIEGTAVVASTDGSAKLTVNLPVGDTEEMTSSSLYVLATDYTTYSLAYSCQNVDNYYRSVAAWKLSRTRSMPPAGNTAINAVINQREELHQPYFIQVEQSEDCAEPSSAGLLSSSLLVVLVTLVFQRLL